MAKIALISRQPELTALPLCYALEQNQHQILLITKKSLEIPIKNEIEVWRVLEDNNYNELFEMRNWILKLLQWNPDVLHFLLESKEPALTEIILAQIGAPLFGTTISTSIFEQNIELQKNKKLRQLVQMSQIVTAPSLDLLGQVRGLTLKVPHQSRGLLPPLLGSVNEPGLLNQEDDLFKNWLKARKPLALPWSIKIFKHLLASDLKDLQAINKNHSIVFLGSLSKIPLTIRNKLRNYLKSLRWSMSETQSGIEHASVLKNCEGLWLAGVPLSTLEYTSYLKLGLSLHKMVIVDSHQAQIHPHLWENSDPGVIIRSQYWQTDRDSILEKIESQCPTPPDSIAQQVLQDQAVNEMNRLYLKSLKVLI